MGCHLLFWNKCHYPVVHTHVVQWNAERGLILCFWEMSSKNEPIMAYATLPLFATHPGRRTREQPHRMYQARAAKRSMWKAISGKTRLVHTFQFHCATSPPQTDRVPKLGHGPHLGTRLTFATSSPPPPAHSNNLLSPYGSRLAYCNLSVCVCAVAKCVMSCSSSNAMMFRFSVHVPLELNAA